MQLRLANQTWRVADLYCEDNLNLISFAKAVDSEKAAAFVLVASGYLFPVTAATAETAYPERR
jgi:hypothetical protein